IRRRAGGTTDSGRPPPAAVRSSPAVPALLVAFTAIAVLGKVVFGFHPLAALAALLAALVLAVVCSRATGETDLAPVGQVGTLTQILFSGLGPILSILAGSISMGTSTQAAQTLW